MAKILISSLGTGNKRDGEYQTAKYQFENNTPHETSFVADAIVKYHKIDKLFLVGTKKSIWDEAYRVFGGEDKDCIEDLYFKKEEGQIDENSLKVFEENQSLSIKPFLIKYGINETEIWENFEEFLKISEHIENGDEIYLDITHSFRSLSMMSFVMTQFASSISDKNFKVSGVFYGMLEYSGENNGVTPIVDIKILLDIQEWIKAIDAIKKYSDFGPLINALESSQVEKSVQNDFISLNNTISMASMGAMKQFIENASKKINSIQKSNNKIVALLAKDIIKLIDELKHEKVSDFQYALAKWFHKNKNYALSYIALYEAIITKSCEIRNLNIDEHSIREDQKKSLGDDKWGKHFYTKRENSISVIRNEIVHQSNKRKDFIKTDIDRLETFIKTFEDYFKLNYAKTN